MQTEASQHRRLSSRSRLLNNAESVKGEQINATAAFSTKAAPKSANAAVTVSTVSFPLVNGWSQRSKDSYIGAITTTVATRSKMTVHMNLLATPRGYDEPSGKSTRADWLVLRLADKRGQFNTREIKKPA
jgi:hypothetical protein